MATAETARLIASLELKDQFTPGVNKALGGLGRLDAGIARSGSRAYKAGQQIGTGIKTGAVIAAGAIGFLATQVGFGLKALTDLESITAQSNAVLKSTKGVAGQTADSVRKLAEQYESLNATIDDKVIQSGENLLLTFTNIRKKAFEPTLKAALDMNQAMGGGEAGLQGTIQKLGKALNDPIKGLTSLGRVGVTFTAQQKKQIETAVKAGNTFKAQGIILAELNKRFGGSFLAGGNTTTGKVAKFKDAIEDLQKALATALLPAIGKVADGLSKFLADPSTIKGVSELGDAIGSMFSDKNLAAGADFLKGAFDTAKSAAPVVAAAAKTTFAMVQAAVGLFKQLPPGLQGLLVGGFALNKLTGGLVTNVAGGIIETVGKQFLQRGGTPANPLFVADVTGGLGALAGAAGGAGAVEGAAAGLGLGTIAAGVAAGTAISALGIMGLGWLITATSTPEQLATAATNARQQEALKRSFGRVDLSTPTGPSTGGLSPEDRQNLSDAAKAFDTRSEAHAIEAAVKPGLFNIGQAITDVTGAIRSTLAPKLDALHQAFKTDLAALIHATKAADIAKAAKRVGDEIGKGVGNQATTEAVLKTLRTQLLHTTDEKTRAVLKAQIARVEKVLPDRKFAAAEYKAVDGILKDGKITASESRKLKSIMQAVKDRGLPAVTKGIQSRIDAAKTAQVRAAHATTAAAAAAALAITNKDLSVNIGPTNVTVNTSVSIRETIKTRTTFKRLGGLVAS